MNILYWAQYNLPKDERKFSEPNPNDYYYSEPDPEAPADLTIIKKILAME